MSAKKKLNKFKLDSRRSRSFSEPLRAHIVEKIKKRELSVSQSSRLWGISLTTLYKWLHQSGVPKNTRQVMELDSEGLRLKQMESRIAELEQALGRKQMELDFVNKMVDLSEEHFKIDIRKKGSTSHSSGSGNTDRSSPTK